MRQQAIVLQGFERFSFKTLQFMIMAIGHDQACKMSNQSAQIGPPKSVQGAAPRTDLSVHDREKVQRGEAEGLFHDR